MLPAPDQPEQQQLPHKLSSSERKRRSKRRRQEAEDPHQGSRAITAGASATCSSQQSGKAGSRSSARSLDHRRQLRPEDLLELPDDVEEGGEAQE